MHAIINAIQALFSGDVIIALIIGLVVVAFLVWKARGWMKDVDWRIKGLADEQENQKDILNEVKSDVSDLKNDVAGLKSDVAGVKSDISGVKSDISDLKKNFSDLWNHLIAPSGKTIIQSTSPLSLTEYGEELSEKIDAEQIADIYADKLKSKVVDKNKYEIQQYCFEYAESALLKDLQKSNKNKYDVITTFAFDAGIDISGLMSVIGIVLRDKLFVMLDTSHSELDKNTPLKS